MQIHLRVGDIIELVVFVVALVTICSANRPRSRSRVE